MRFYEFTPLLLSALATAAPLASDLGAGRVTTVLSRRQFSPSHNAVLKESSPTVEIRDAGETFVDGLEDYFKTLPKRSDNPLSIRKRDAGASFTEEIEEYLEKSNAEELFLEGKRSKDLKVSIMIAFTPCASNHSPSSSPLNSNDNVP
ncbi:hypothetical protein MMC14_009366 [Varicellaria rhodocarpa]|nr:hypothetical protein [Varicellaria rhodocarpa]